MGCNRYMDPVTVFFFKCSLIENTFKVYVLDWKDGSTVKVYVLLTLRPCNEISGGSNFKEQGLILAHSWRDQSPSLGKAL